jgi:hypothetical protein
MITTPTVLVLGAGASSPYGFPTAKELEELICDAFSSPTEKASQLLGGDESQYAPKQFFEFREAFLRSPLSIDAFLQRRREFLEVGKLAIAYCLILFETEANLYRRDRDLRGGNWYKYLAGKLDSAFEEFGDNKLSIITFNYDRSLEYYLLNSLIHSHGKKRDECVNALATIPIVHVYGQLGEKPYPQQGCRRYHPNEVEQFRYVETAADGIKLYYEEAKAATEKARELLTRAKHVCFLGFGYHAFNVDRLNIGGCLDLSTTVIGTTRGLFRMEVRSAKNRLAQAIGGDITLNEDVADNLNDNLNVLKQHMFLD